MIAGDEVKEKRGLTTNIIIGEKNKKKVVMIDGRSPEHPADILGVRVCERERKREHARARERERERESA